MRLLKLLLVIFVCAAGPAVAGPLEDGIAAAQKGDYATTVCLQRQVADKGGGRAQYDLGDMYERGVGVPNLRPLDLGACNATAIRSASP